MKKMFILLILSLFISSSCIEEMKAQEKKTSLSDMITFIDGEEMEANYFVDSCIKAFGSINSKDLASISYTNPTAPSGIIASVNSTLLYVQLILVTV